MFVTEYQTFDWFCDTFDSHRANKLVCSHHLATARLNICFSPSHFCFFASRPRTLNDMFSSILITLTYVCSQVSTYTHMPHVCVCVCVLTCVYAAI